MTPGGRDDRLDDDRARAVWHRAAQLQAEAARRLEERARRSAERSGVESDPGMGLLPSEVEAAAVEAGISPEFVQLALAEQGGALDPGKELTGWIDRLATRVLRTPERSIEISRSIRASPRAVLEAMQRMLPNPPYGLTLLDTVGDDPLDGAILVFDVPSVWTSSQWSSFAYAMSYPDIKQLRFMIRPDDDDSERCEVVVSVDLRYGVWLNFLVGNGASGTVGAGGAVAGAVMSANGVFGAALAGVLGGALMGGAGLLLVGGAASWGYGHLYRWALRKGTREIEKLLQQIEANARLGGGFSPAPAATAALPPTGARDRGNR